MKNQYLLFLISLLSLTSCKQYYAIADFDEVTRSHQTVAVLPFEIEISGYVPSELTDEDILNIKESESKAFQASFHNQILRSTRNGKKPLRIKVQHYSQTLSRLADENISILDSWTKSPEALAQALGVDAVVRGRIEKEKYFPDGLSAGIDIATTVLDVLGDGSLNPVSSNNKNVKTDYALIAANDGTVLWSINYTCEADWQRRSAQIIENINRRSANRFPYRTK